MRNRFRDRWTVWPRLPLYRTWSDEHGNLKLDGTNNATERRIGWWVKERYRAMRGDTREQSAFHVSRLIAYAGNHLARGLNRACLIASTRVMFQPPPTILYPIPFSTKFGTITT